MMVLDDKIQRCSFEDLTPSFFCGSIKGYDANSFKHIDCMVSIPEAPEQPVVIKADVIAIGDGKLAYTPIGNGNVLVFHGHSTKDFWRQKFPPHTDVEEIIEEAARSVDIAFVAVCNPGRYILGARGGVSPQNYFGSMGAVTILRGDRISLSLRGEKIFRKGEKYD